MLNACAGEHGRAGVQLTDLDLPWTGQQVSLVSPRRPALFPLCRFATIVGCRVCFSLTRPLKSPTACLCGTIAKARVVMLARLRASRRRNRNCFGHPPRLCIRALLQAGWTDSSNPAIRKGTSRVCNFELFVCLVFADVLTAPAKAI